MNFFDVFFRRSGRIHRAGFVMIQAYACMGFLVSLGILTHYESLFLIPGGYDVWYVFRFVCALFGLVVSIYIYIVSFIKRLRDTGDFPKFLWVLCVPFSNVFFAFKKGMSGQNEYGSDPKELYTFTKKTTPGLWLDFVIFICVDIVIFLMAIVLFDLPIWFEFFFALVCLLVLVGVCSFYHSRFADKVRTTPKQKQTSRGHFWIEVLMILTIVFFIRSFFITPYQILGPSMDPNFFGGESSGYSYEDGEFILVDKMSLMYFGFWEMNTPNRGDVVVFTPRVSPVKKYLIKRIIGLPGEMLKIEGGYVWIKQVGQENYTQLNETYLSDKNNGATCLRYVLTDYSCSDSEKQKVYEYRIPEGKFFVMGDNRAQSLDSRQCFHAGGCSLYRDAQFIPRSQIQGLVRISLGHFDLVDSVIPFSVGSLSWEQKPRWTDIARSHEYPELNF